MGERHSQVNPKAGRRHCRNHAESSSRRTPLDALPSDGAGGVVGVGCPGGCLSCRTEVFGIHRFVAARASQWRQCGKEDALDDPGWTNELSLATEFPGEEREREHPWHAPRVRLAVI